MPCLISDANIYGPIINANAPPKIEETESSPELTLIKSDAIRETKTSSTLYLFPFILHHLFSQKKFEI